MQDNLTSPDIDFSTADDYLLQEGDVLFARTGASVGKTYIYRRSDGDLYFAGFLIRAKIKSDYDADFVFQNTLTDSYDSYIRITSQRSGQPGVNAQEYANFALSVPSLAEQKKIGSYFSHLDNLITLHQRKCDALQKFKRAMLQKMFPQNGESVPEIRFAGFTDAWEQRKLEDFGKATGGTSIESEFDDNGIYKVISIGSYSEDSVYRDQGIRVIDSEKTRNRILNKGDLTMILNDKTASGNIIGRALLIEESDVYVYNQRTERIEINHDYYDSLFIYEMLNAPNMRDKIIKQSQGNTQIYVNWSTIASTEYLIPIIEEQRKIGAYFRTIDSLITLHQRKLETLQKMKKALLQKMFV